MFKTLSLPARVKATCKVSRELRVVRPNGWQRFLMVHYMRPGLPGTTVVDGTWYCLQQEKRVLWWGWKDIRLTMLASVFGEAQPQFAEVVEATTSGRAQP